ncbi:MAG: Fur family transcriptional regulator [Filifactoraceae bacterium]
MQKYSKQREEVRKAIMMNKVHPTADEVYSIVRKTNPNISLGTVYRNLNKLAEHGVIRKIEMPNGSDRFDGMMEPHYHVVCTECGNIHDVELSILDNLAEAVRKSTGAKLSSHNLIMYGVCEACQKPKS